MHSFIHSFMYYFMHSFIHFKVLLRDTFGSVSDIQCAIILLSPTKKAQLRGISALHVNECVNYELPSEESHFDST